MCGRMGGMSESERDALAGRLAEIDQVIAEKEEVILALDDDAWRKAERSLAILLDLRRDLEWQLLYE
jgi:hypothetical protein